MSVPAIGAAVMKSKVPEEEKKTMKPQGKPTIDQFEDDLDNLLQPTANNSKIGVNKAPQKALPPISGKPKNDMDDLDDLLDDIQPVKKPA